MHPKSNPSSRFFVSAKASWSLTKYVELLPCGECRLVLHNGERKCCCHRKKECDYNVNNGFWKEVTKEQL